MSANFRAVAAYNRQQKQRIDDLRATAKYLASMKAGKSVRSARHKMGGAKGDYFDGYYFQSAKELAHYKDLKLMREANLIKALMVHPPADIVINGVKICRVVCDFSYFDVKSGKTIVEDVKKERIGRDGKVKFTTDTMLSKIKQKLMLAVLGIRVVIVK